MEVYQGNCSKSAVLLCCCSCSTVLAGVSLSLTDRLQSVLNAAARLVFSTRRSEHVTPLLRDLHWLKVPERIKFPVPSLCSDIPFLADRTNGRAIGTVLRLSVCRLSVCDVMYCG